jgi:hypothetical protein
MSFKVRKRKGRKCEKGCNCWYCQSDMKWNKKTTKKEKPCLV